MPQVTKVRERIRVWDLPTRLFHWTLVASVLIAFLSSEEDSALADWHIPAGWIAAVLIAFRLIWGFVGGEHARFANFLRPGHLISHLKGLLRRRPQPTLGHNPLGALAIIALLGMVAAVVATGVTMFGGEDLHETLAWTLLALIGVHVAAVLVTSLVTRDNLVGAMMTGTKEAERHPGARDARGAGWYALPVSGALAGLAAFGATTVDPLAFAPHARADEAEGEHEEDGRGGYEEHANAPDNDRDH